MRKKNTRRDEAWQSYMMGQRGLWKLQYHLHISTSLSNYCVAFRALIL